MNSLFYLWDTGTPPGEESRLTRAMKAYHIEKARDPSDLPPWLFEEHERRPLDWSTTTDRYREGAEYGVHEPRGATAPRRTRGLRDVYDAAAAATPLPSRQETREAPRMRQGDASATPPSKANDRLRALRDAKRDAATQRNKPSPSVRMEPTDDKWSARMERGRRHEPDRGKGVGRHSRAPSLPANVRPTVGLPPRPVARKY
jgi:hypothetical protein